MNTRIASLDSPRAKLARAEEHRQALEREIRAFVETDPFRLSPPEFDRANEHFVMGGHVVTEPPLRLGIILGDYVNAVRCALDHLVWQLALLNDSKPSRQSSFPICSAPKEFENRSKKVLGGLADSHKAEIERLQPYHHAGGSDAHVLRALQWLSNNDKHRVVHSMLTSTRDADPGTAGFRLVEGSGQLGKAQIQLGAAWREGEPIVRVRLDPPDPAARVEWYGKIDVGIVFGEPGEREVSHEIVQQFQAVGKVIVGHFETAFAKQGN